MDGSRGRDRGERQRGELGPWSRALTRLAAGGLDIALQELDWATIPTAGTPGAKYPIVAVANLCANSETCFFTSETVQAQRALQLIKSSVAAAGRLVLNADDFAVAEENDGAEGLELRYLVGISADAPCFAATSWPVVTHVGWKTAPSRFGKAD